MERLGPYNPDGESGDGLRSIEPQEDEVIADNTYSKLKELLLFEIKEGNDKSEAERAAFYAEHRFTFEEKRQLFSDLGMPMPSPAIDPQLLAHYNPDEPYGWLRLAGSEPTEEEIELYGKPVEAFVTHVVGDDNEAQEVLDGGSYSIPRYVEALNKLALFGDETQHFDEFEKLTEFAFRSRYVFPHQFPDLVEAMSRGEHPLTRGSASFCLPDLAKTSPKQATRILQRLMQDPGDLRVPATAVTIYNLEMGPGRRGGEPLSRRQHRSLGKLAIRAKKRLDIADQSGLDTVDYNDYWRTS
jgi:hypothetical protein